MKALVLLSVSALIVPAWGCTKGCSSDEVTSSVKLLLSLVNESAAQADDDSLPYLLARISGDGADIGVYRFEDKNGGYTVPSVNLLKPDTYAAPREISVVLEEDVCTGHYDSAIEKTGALSGITLFHSQDETPRYSDGSATPPPAVTIRYGGQDYVWQPPGTQFNDYRSAIGNKFDPIALTEAMTSLTFYFKADEAVVDGKFDPSLLKWRAEAK